MVNAVEAYIYSLRLPLLALLPAAINSGGNGKLIGYSYSINNISGSTVAPMMAINVPF